MTVADQKVIEQEAIQKLISIIVTKNMNSFPDYYYYLENYVQNIHNSLMLKYNSGYWQLSKNLCFGNYKEIWSELREQHANFNFPPPPNRPIPIQLLIINLFDYFSFCKNLIFNENIESVWINVELINTKNRYLGSFYMDRDLDQNRKCLSSQIKTSSTISKGDLLSSYQDIAIDYILNIFRNFQFDNFSKDSVLSIYNSYLNGDLR